MQDDFAFSLVLPGLFKRADEVLQITQDKVNVITALAKPDAVVLKQAKAVREAFRLFKASVDPASGTVASHVQVEYINGQACGVTVDEVGSP